MSLTLNSTDARRADQFSSVIRESGKYVGIITRAEKLLSRGGTQGVGISFKSDDGASANYLDLYTVKENGDTLRGHSIVQAILCCTKTKVATEGEITFGRWDPDLREMVDATEVGYPELMGKRIGFVLQKELTTHSITGQDVDRMTVLAVFEAGTELTASEILDKKTKAEKLPLIMKMLERNPVRDSRKRGRQQQAAHGDPIQTPPANSTDWNDDIPFAFAFWTPLAGLLASALVAAQFISNYAA